MLSPRLHRLAVATILATLIMVLSAPPGSWAAPARSSSRSKTPPLSAGKGAKPAAVSPAKKPRPPRRTRHLVTLVDDTGHARVHFTDLRSALPVVTSSEAIVSLPAGLVLARSETDLGRRYESWNGQAQVDLKPDRVLARAHGQFGAMTEGSSLDALLESHQDGGAFKTSGRLQADLPVDLSSLPFSRLSLRVQTSGTYRESTSTSKLTVVAAFLQRPEVPYRFDIRLGHSTRGLEADALLVVSEKHWLARNLREMAAHAADSSSTLVKSAERLKVALTDVVISEPACEAGQVGIRVQLTARNFSQAVRDSFRPFFTLFDVGVEREKRLDAAFDQMASMRIEAFHLLLTRRDAQLDVTCDSRLSRTDAFVVGYLAFYSELFAMFQEVPVFKALADSPWSTLRFRLLSHQLRSLSAAFEQARTSDDASHLDLAFDLSNADGHVKASGNLGFDADLRALAKAARTQGIRTVDQQDLRLALRTQGEEMVADGLLDQRGPWVEIARDQYVAAARDVKALEPVATLLASMQLRGGRFVAQMTGGKVTTRGYLQASNAAPLAQELARQFVPRLPGRPLGAEVRFVQRGGNKLSRTVDIYLEDVPREPQVLTRELTRLLRAQSCDLRQVKTSADATLPALPLPVLPEPTPP